MNKQCTPRRLLAIGLAIALVGQIAAAQGIDNMIRAFSEQKLRDVQPPAELLIDDGSGSKGVMPMQTLKKSLLDSPDYAYDSHGQRDPMVLFWTQYRLSAEQALKAARAAMDRGDLAAAEGAFDRVIALAKQSRQRGYTIAQMEDYVKSATIGLVRVKLKAAQIAFQKGELEKARAGFQQVRVIIDQLRAQGLEDEALDEIISEVEKGLDEINKKLNIGAPGVGLPQWIINNTSGMLYDDERPFVLVGPYVLGIGDTVPQVETEVTVVKINKKSVTYRVSETNQLYTISLEEGE